MLWHRPLSKQDDMAFLKAFDDLIVKSNKIKKYRDSTEFFLWLHRFNIDLKHSNYISMDIWMKDKCIFFSFFARNWTIDCIKQMIFVQKTAFFKNDVALSLDEISLSPIAIFYFIEIFFLRRIRYKIVYCSTSATGEVKPSQTMHISAICWRNTSSMKKRRIL